MRASPLEISRGEVKRKKSELRERNSGADEASWAQKNVLLLLKTTVKAE